MRASLSAVRRERPCLQVLAMDAELTADLSRRGLPVFDDSAMLAAWNATVLQVRARGACMHT